MIHLSVVIPVYRAGDALPELHERLCAALERLTDRFEILFVEDCGGDDSWQVVQEIAARDSRVRGIQFSRNFGQHAATICGIARAQGDWVVTMDDDLEQNPEDIALLYAKAQEGYDLVYGVYRQRTHSPFRNITSGIARRLFRIAIPSLNDDYTSFRILRQNVAQALPMFDSPTPFIDGYLSWVTNRYGTVTVEHGTRYRGVSNYTVKKLIAHTVNIFVSFSDLPLKIATWVGLGSALAGLLGLLLIFGAKLLGGITVSGYASLMAAIVLFGGLQMFVLGIMGEYLSRINFKTSRKPIYLVARETDRARERERISR